MSEKISDFELKFQSSSQRQDGDNLVVDVNWATESDHEIYGAAFVTTTFAVTKVVVTKVVVTGRFPAL